MSVAALCKGCGAELPPAKATGRKRSWCSDHCRKQTTYGVPCSVCGEKRYNGKAKPGETRICARCHSEARADAGREHFIAEIQRWAELYGGPPSALEWNIAHARRVLAASTVAEIKRRHREDGPWPSASGVQAAFGSWAGGIEAAGFTTRGEQRSAVRDNRGRQIVGWWAEGLSYRQIGERLGWSRQQAGREVSHLRELGYDLPYRYRMKDGKRVAA